jgi:hypothetical protein
LEFWTHNKLINSKIDNVIPGIIIRRSNVWNFADNLPQENIDIVCMDVLFPEQIKEIICEIKENNKVITNVVK